MSQVKKLLVTTSWDDGSKEDLKLAELLNKYEIPATFYISSDKLLGDKGVRALSREFEIGGHGLAHKDLSKVSLKIAEKEISKNKCELENITGKSVRSFAYPLGKFNSDLKQMVGFCGFEYARTTSLFELFIGDKVTGGTTVHAYNHNPLLFFKEGFNKRLFFKLITNSKFSLDWEQLAILAFEEARKTGGIYHLWGHSWEIEKYDGWQKLSRVLSYMRNNTQLSQRKTNIETLGFFRAKKKLYYDKQYKKPRDKMVSGYVQKLISGFDKKGFRILDIGCGDGYVSGLFKEADYLGVDSSESAIRLAKKNFAAENRRFVVSQLSNLKRLSSLKFDLILLLGTLEDEPNIPQIFGGLRSFIREGTRLIITLHDTENIVFRIQEYVRREFGLRPFPFASYSMDFIEKELPLSLRPKERFRSFKVWGFGKEIFVVSDF